MAKDRPPSFQWFPRDFMSDPVVLAMPDRVELAYRRALDASWVDGGYGVGTRDEWCRWGRVPEAWRQEFLDHLWAATIQCGDVFVQLRMARDRMEQELRYRSLKNRPQNKTGGRPVAHGELTVEPQSSASAVKEKEKTERRPVRKEITPEAIKAAARKHLLPSSTVQRLADKIALEASWRRYADLPRALNNWCEIEAQKPGAKLNSSEVAVLEAGGEV